ncbi:MAG: ABC transporter substrate-binding protein [Geminicoccaceae bacterium]
MNTRNAEYGSVGRCGRRYVLGLTALLLTFRGGTAGATAVDGSAQAFIQRLGNQTLAILDEPVTPEQRLQGLKQLLDQSTDLELIARLVLGRYWREANASQREEYVRLFKELVMQTMAERFSWYTGETFEITSAKPVDDRDTMVATRILRPSGKPPILVEWRVRQSDSGYLLIDILAEGVSLVVTQRSEAAEVISQRGVDGLLADLRARLAKRNGLAAT